MKCPFRKTSIQTTDYGYIPTRGGSGGNGAIVSSTRACRDSRTQTTITDFQDCLVHECMAYDAYHGCKRMPGK